MQMDKQRVVLSLTEEDNEKFDTLCKRYGTLTRTSFMEAMINCLDHSVMDETIEKYLVILNERRKEKNKKRKEIRDAVKSLSKEELDSLLASRQQS